MIRTLRCPPLFPLSSRRRWMELPVCNLHSLIINKPPIPFNYNRCPFWLIVRLHSGVQLVIMPPHITWKQLLMSRTDVFMPPVSGLFKMLFCLKCCLTWPFFFSFVLNIICLLLRVCPALPVRKERTETSDRWWVWMSERFLLFSRTTQREEGKLCWLFWSFWLVAEFGNSSSLLTDASEVCGRWYWRGRKHLCRWKACTLC